MRESIQPLPSKPPKTKDKIKQNKIKLILV